MKNFLFFLILFFCCLTQVEAQTLACNALVKVALGTDGVAEITADMLLEGGPYDYDSMTVVPSSVTTVEVGLQQYTVTDANGNSCWGALEVFNTIGSSLACIALVNVTLDASGEAELTPGQLLATSGAVDYSDLTITPEVVTLANSKGVYTVTDETTNNSCWGQYIATSLNPAGNQNLICNGQINVSVDPWVCSATISPDILLEGGPYDFSTVTLSESELAVGNHSVTVTDNATGSFCWGTVTVVDNTPPIAIAVQDIVVTLSSQTDSIKVFIDQVNNGSFDPCSEVTLSPEYFTFGCGDLGVNQVFLIVTDAAGNSNSVFADIIVETEGPIFLDCPGDIVVNCSDVFSSLADPTVTPLYCIDAVSYEELNGIDIDGDGEIADVIGPDGDVYLEADTSCSDFVFQRQWSVQGNNCSHNVYVKNDSPFDETSIVWPESKSIDCLDEAFDEPIWARTCDFIGFTVASDTLHFDSVSCIRIINTWTVVNWCTDDVYMSTNILDYASNTAPQLEVPLDLTIDGFVDELTFSAAIESNCPSEVYRWEVTVDLNSDLNDDFQWSSFAPIDLGTNASPLWDDDNGDGVLDISVGNPGDFDNANSIYTRSTDTYDISIPFGFVAIPANERHRILWKVFDACGNVTSQTSYFTITETISSEGPVPVCLKVIASTTSGSNDVVILAKDFDGGSYDNTTASENLRFTFSDVDPTLDVDFDPQRNSSKKIYTDVVGSSFLTEEIYVWDEDGNVNSCLVNLSLLNPFFSGVEFSTPDMIVEKGDRICVPLYAENFNCINSLEGSLSWDASVLEYANVENIALPGADSGNFNTFFTGEGKFSFSWFDDVTNFSGFTSSATDPLFELCFEVIGDIGTSSIVGLSSDLTPPNVSAVGDKNDPTQPTVNLDFVSQSGVVTVGSSMCDEMSIQWPLDIIDITSHNLSVNTVEEIVSIDNLTSVLGFGNDKVVPILSANCDFVSSFSDEIFDLDDGEFLVSREWSVLDFSDTTVYGFSQLISITPDNTYICDFLPNDAAVGDCGSGHTDTDDVEWPADINIGDHRITPSELVAFSSIAAQNSRPVFVNTPDLYTATYEDLLDSLGQDLLVVGRRWSVVREGVPGTVWTYTQRLNIDLAMLVGLVSTNTISYRALPNVSVNDVVSTDLNGLAEADLSTVSLEYMDDLKNGLSIRDIVMIQRSILGLDVLSDLQLLAADYVQDNDIDGLDIIEIRKVLLGIYPNEPVGWLFYNTSDLQDENNSTVVIGNTQSHLGVKLGDVDDDAVLTGVEPIYNQLAFHFDDQLLNVGQNYEVPLILDEATSLYGIELAFDFDEDKYEIIDISSDFAVDVSFYVQEGLLKVVLLKGEEITSLEAGDEILKLNLRAIDNSILSSGLSLATSEPSLMVNDAIDLIELVGEVEGVITTDVNDITTEALSIFPNPATEVFYINTSNIDLGSKHCLSLYNTSGTEVFRAYDVTQVDVSNFDSGLYLVVIETDRGKHIGKLNVLRP